MPSKWLVGSLLSVRFNHKPGYKPCDLLWIQFLSLVEITAFRLERIFQPMRALQFITGHVVYAHLIIKSYGWKRPSNPRTLFMHFNHFGLANNLIHSFCTEYADTSMLLFCSVKWLDTTMARDTQHSSGTKSGQGRLITWNVFYCYWAREGRTQIMFTDQAASQQDSSNYRIIASSNTSHLEAHPGIYRLLMKGILDAYILWPVDKQVNFLINNMR